MADAPKTRKFVALKGIFVTTGKKSKVGAVVELTSAQAKHYNKLKAIGPYIEDDEAEE